MELVKVIKEARVWKKSRNFRMRAIIVLVEFLAIMLVLTVLSRGIYAHFLPQVSVVNPVAKNLTHIVETEGIIQKESESAIIVPEGVRVKEIYVKEGTIIEEGTPLFSYDLEDAGEQVETIQTELAKINLQLQGETLNQKAAEEKKKTDLVRAEQDYKMTDENAKKEIDTALTDFNNAKARRNELTKEEDYIKEKEQGDTQIKDSTYQISMLEEEIKKIQEEIEKTDSSVSGNDLVANELQKKKAEKEKEAGILKNSLENYKSSLRANAKAEWEGKKKELDTTVQAQEKMYQSSLTSKEKERLEANRGMEDVKMPEAQEYSLEICRLDKEQKEKELAKFTDIIKAEGIIKSDREGMITKQGIITGERTGSNAAFLVADMDDTLNFTTTIAKEQLKYVAMGDEASIRFYGTKKELDGMPIERIRESTENAENYQLTIPIPAKDVVIGQTGTLKVEKQTEKYPACIPLDAVYSENNKSYIFVINAKETFLGEEWKAEKRYVEIVDKNLQYAALADDVIAEDEKIITATTKELKGRETVRLQEEF